LRLQSAVVTAPADDNAATASWPSPAPRTAWLMLLALTTGFALSQAFRSLPAIMAPPLAREFGLSPQALGVFAGVFHFAFGALQFAMGIGIDVFGLRRTVLFFSPLAILGAVISAAAPGYGWLLLGQVLAGIGCAPAFLVCTVFIARSFPTERFAAVSGLILGVGSIGLLLTGTPLAWLVEHASWRAGFVVLAASSALAWLAILMLVREPGGAPARGERTPIAQALRGYGPLFRLPHTAGILVLGLFTYAAFLSLRGLWLGPLLIARHGFTLVESGHVALAVSVVSMFGPPLFGRLDPGARRRRWLVGFTLVLAALFVLMAAGLGAAPDVALAIAVGILSGYMVLQYADVRAAYPAAMTGRAMAVFTMSIFLGVALMQWLTGVVASLAAAAGLDPYRAVLGAIAAMLLLGAAAFKVLPQPRPAVAAQAAESGA
jgi:predicted MFS family arabinose efflux permease